MKNAILNRSLIVLFCLLTFALKVPGQTVYQIKADSVRIFSSCDTAELILENRTRKVLGFLYNKGEGRTEFRKMELKSLGDTAIALAGIDTIAFRSANKIYVDTLYFSGDSLYYRIGSDSYSIFIPETDPSVPAYTKTLSSASKLLTEIETVDGTNSGLDADLLDGYQPSVSALANTIALRNVNGYLYAPYFNNTNTVINTDGSSIAGINAENGDGFIRKYNADAIKQFLGLSSASTTALLKQGTSGNSNSYIPEVSSYSHTITTAGWYRIAHNGPVQNGGSGGDRFDAYITVRDITSGFHSSATFLVKGEFNNQPTITLLGRSSYGGNGTIKAIRIVNSGSTYGGAAIEVYVAGAAAAYVNYTIQDNYQPNGLIPDDWTPAPSYSSAYPVIDFHFDQTYTVGNGATTSVMGLADENGVDFTVDRSGNLRAHDLWATRGNNTGIVYLGDGSHYLFYDGSQYNFNGSPLRINSGVKLSNSSANGNVLDVTSNYGYIRIGSENSAYAHFLTDRPAFYFDHATYASGGFRAYDAAANETGFDASNFSFTSGDGKGVRFWNSDSYKIWMSASANSTWGGKIPSLYESPVDDYNIYYKISGNGRGHAFIVGDGSMPVQITTTGLNVNNWIRSYGNYGWYSQTYHGGIYMTDDTWVRVYGSKGFWVDNTLHATSLTVSALPNAAYLATDATGKIVAASAQAVAGLQQVTDAGSTTNHAITAAGFYQTSLRSLKRDIRPFNGHALDILDSVRVRIYYFKADSTRRQRVGFIEDEAPAGIRIRGKGVDESNAVGILYKAVQELKAEVEEQKMEINKLKAYIRETSKKGTSE